MHMNINFSSYFLRKSLFFIQWKRQEDQSLQMGCHCEILNWTSFTKHVSQTAWTWTGHVKGKSLTWMHVCSFCDSLLHHKEMKLKRSTLLSQKFWQLQVFWFKFQSINITAIGLAVYCAALCDICKQPVSTFPAWSLSDKVQPSPSHRGARGGEG